MDAQSDGSPFDNVEPHCHLAAEAKVALWAACELVLGRPGDFADAMAWLNEGYSEAPIRERLLRDSERTYKLNLWDLRHNRDRCDTFPRRLALRATRPNLKPEQRLRYLKGFWSVPEINGVSDGFAKDLIEHPEKVREWVVNLTVSISRSRGRMLRGDQCIITNDRKPEDVAVDASNAETVWRWLDEQCRRTLRHLNDERRDRDVQRREQAKDRAGRLRQAVADAMETGLPAGREERTHARRVVLLACLLAYQHELKLPGEFGTWQWESTGSLFAELVGGTYVPGREKVLFDSMPGTHKPFLPGVDVGPFADLVNRAVRVYRDGLKVHPSAQAGLSAHPSLSQTPTPLKPCQPSETKVSPGQSHSQVWRIRSR